MQVLERTHSGNSLINMESWFLSEERCIFIDKTIDSESAEQFKREILYLLSKDDTAPIVIQINSCGGNVAAGMLICDVIHTCPAPIHTVCTEKAYSMGAVILACAHKGRRYIMPNSQTMLHEVLTSGGVGGSCSTVKAISDMLTETKEKIDKLLSEHMGRKLSDVKKLTSTEHYFSAAESIENGLCDAIIDFNGLWELIKSTKQ